MKYGFEMFEYNYRECELIHSFISPESVIRSICEDYVEDCTDCPFGRSTDQTCGRAIKGADFWTIAEHLLAIVNGNYGCHLIMMYYQDNEHEGRIAFSEEGIMPRVWDTPFVVDPEDLDFIFKKDLEFFNENMELPGVFCKIVENEVLYNIDELKELEELPVEKKEKETRTEEKENIKMANQNVYEWKDNFKDECNKEGKIEGMEFYKKTDELAKRQLEDGWTPEEIKKAALSPLKWSLGRPKKEGTYIVVVGYYDVKERVTSMQFCDWDGEKWEVSNDEIVLCWTIAPDFPKIMLQLGDQTEPF